MNLYKKVMRYEKTPVGKSKSTMKRSSLYSKVKALIQRWF